MAVRIGINTREENRILGWRSCLGDFKIKIRALSPFHERKEVLGNIVCTCAESFCTFHNFLSHQKQYMEDAKLKSSKQA
ncbi:hypothetical protein K1719_011489 [Acacia pycnantha]|nr:hypothetical protein K1719_011489 [Acacia pycnantha]